MYYISDKTLKMNVNAMRRLWSQIKCVIYLNVESNDRSAVFNVADYDQACCGGKVQLTG